MRRPWRVEYPGALYHVMSRGDRREPLCLDEGDGHAFIKTLGEACRKARFEIPALCRAPAAEAPATHSTRNCINGRKRLRTSKLESAIVWFDPFDVCRRAGGLKLRELAALAGMRDYTAVAVAAKRFEQGLAASRPNRQQLQRVCQLSNVEM